MKKNLKFSLYLVIGNGISSDGRPRQRLYTGSHDKQYLKFDLIDQLGQAQFRPNKHFKMEQTFCFVANIDGEEGIDRTQYEQDFINFNDTFLESLYEENPNLRFSIKKENRIKATTKKPVQGFDYNEIYNMKGTDRESLKQHIINFYNEFYTPWSEKLANELFHHIFAEEYHKYKNEKRLCYN